MPRLLHLVALAVATACVYLVHRLQLAHDVEQLRNAASVIAGTDATLLGFLVSAGALLYAVANTRLARNLQRTGHFSRLLAELFTSALAFLLALVAAWTCLFLAPGADVEVPGPLRVGVYTIIFINAVATVLLVSLGHKMWLLLTNLRPDETELE